MVKKYCSVIICFVCLLASIILCKKFNYEGNPIINYEAILNLEVAFFSVSLAIVALMITVLDKYKEKVADLGKWSKYSANVMKELSENTVALFAIIMLLIISSIINPVLSSIPCINIMSVILIFSVIISLIVMFDTTVSVHKLVSNLKDMLADKIYSNENLSEKEWHIIGAYRFLNEQGKKSFEDLLRALTTNQQLDSNKPDK